MAIVALLAAGVFGGTAALVGQSASAPRVHPSPSRPFSDARVTTLDAIQSTLAAGCLTVRAELLLDDSLAVVLESVGTIDRGARIGDFRHVLQRDELIEPLVVRAWHEDERITLWPEAPTGSTHESVAPWLVTMTPSELARVGIPQATELARVGRYQPTVAIDLLAGVDVASIDPLPNTSGLVGAIIDLDTAVSVDHRIQPGADAFPVRQMRAIIELGEPLEPVRRIEYRLEVPTGAGGAAHGVTWALTTQRCPTT